MSFGHSTKTALLNVVNDLFLSLIKGNIFVLALLDISSAIDTIYHFIFIHHLHTDFRFANAVFQQFLSYLTDKTQYISLSNYCSAFPPENSYVPQVQFLPSTLSLCLPLLIHSLSCTIHLLMTCIDRYMLLLTKYSCYCPVSSHL